MFHLPLSNPAYQEIQTDKHRMDNLELNEAMEDSWPWRDGGKIYTAKRYYTYFHKPIVSNPILNWIWAPGYTMKNHGFCMDVGDG